VTDKFRIRVELVDKTNLRGPLLVNVHERRTQPHWKEFVTYPRYEFEVERVQHLVHGQDDMAVRCLVEHDEYQRLKHDPNWQLRDQ
jgi:hypothetical protein